MTIAKRKFDTEYLQEQDQAHFLHPWQEFDAPDDEGRLVIAGGEGSHVYDSDGKAYLDGIGGMWCVNAGYGRRELSEIMAEQARMMPYYSTFTDTTNAPAVQLAGKLAELFLQLLCVALQNLAAFAEARSVGKVQSQLRR